MKQTQGQQQHKQLDKSIDGEAKRNLHGSIEQCKEELRDAYMNFKDLWQKCNIDMRQPVEIGKEEHTVYYFKPETFLVDEPEKQRVYRENILRNVGGIPKPEPIVYLGDELHRNFCQTVADRTPPSKSKAFLLEFFRRRQYTLQHMKYKLLCRWAHHNMTSETIENMNNEFSFIYGKIEFNLEQAISRITRLEQDDFYDSATTDQKPTTRTADGGSLYVEKFDLKPQSLIREDDVEVYMRGVAYRNKILKTVNKLMSRLKWVPLRYKHDIFERAVEEAFKLKQCNIDRQQAIVDMVSRKCRPACTTPELSQELDSVLENYYINRYKHMFTSYVDKTLHQWRANHDEAPSLVMDIALLKHKILENSAKSIQIKGDIELDHGFSYSYQVSVLFPSHFQLLILKSQFSLYDEQSGDDDTQNLQKRTLNLMTKIDTNIFRDLSTQKGTVPSDEALQSELKSIDLKVLRLRSAAYWVDYCILRPSDPEWHQKQQAILNSNNPIDSLLRSGMNFLDVNDLATVNRINEDTARVHQQNILKLRRNDPHNQLKKRVISQQTSDAGERYLNIDLMPARSSLSPAGNAEFHLLSAVQDQEESQPDEQARQNTFCTLPTHLLTAYFTLRYLRQREAKNRILYTLNYFRAVQKRLALDLREFATRDRIEAHQANPFIQAKEANHNIINNSSFAAKSLDRISKKQTIQSNISALGKNMTVFDESAIKKIDNMASLRQYKLEGFFNQKILSTCPSYPKYHASHGEPIYRQPVSEEMDRSRNESISSAALKLMGRIEFIEINEERREVYVRDDFGIYIMYDCTLQDMKCLEEELCKIGSYFIHKGEVLLDPTSTRRPVPVRDRLELIQDLLVKEAEFQFQKVKLCQVYMECYEHVTDPLEQQKLMQVITDVMARRPRLNLSANYFVDAYDAEITCLEKQFDLIKTLVDLQISLEKTENKRLGDSLCLSYELANQYATNKWKYHDSHELLAILRKKQEAAKKAKEQEAASSNMLQSSIENGEEMISSHASQALRSQVKPPSNLNTESSCTESEDVASEYGQDEENKFTQLLGLPQITLESIYQSYKEKDVNVIKLMSEHSHFIAVHEGYPEFLTRLTHRAITDKTRTFSPNSWSQETGSLDFYETLDFAARFFAVTQQMQQELYDGLKVWEPTLMTQIDIQVAHYALEELRTVLKIQDGTLTGYLGREYVEDEQIMGSSDKMIYYCKEMISDLTFKPKDQLDPHVIAKLDLETVNYFEFPKIPYENNKYLQMRKGIAGLDYLILSEKLAIAGVAKDKIDAAQKKVDTVRDLLSGNQQDILNTRNITVPSLLRIYCNMMELHRMRSEIIMAAAESQILGKIYVAQMEQVGNKGARLLQAEGIPFDQHLPFDADQNFVNFVEHGCALGLQIDLAIKEFDSSLLSNFNFRNPDAFKLNVLTSGLEEVRAILQYQILQKHTLIVATRLNQLLIDTASRGLAECRLLEKHKIALPNAIIDYRQLVNRNFDTINFTAIKAEFMRLKQVLCGTVAPLVYSISSKKSSNRSMLGKEFSQYQTTVQQAIPHQDYGIVRIMRCYKLKLLTRLVHNALNEIYLDSNKIRALQSCQRLRQFNRLFMCQTKEHEMGTELLKYETSTFYENFPNNYLPSQFSEEPKIKDVLKPTTAKSQIFKIVQPTSFEILDYFGIPSSSSLMQIESSNVEDLRSVKARKLANRATALNAEVSDELKDFSPATLEPENHLKQLLPTFTPEPRYEFLGARRAADDQAEQKSTLSSLDYKEAIYFGDSKFANFSQYYLALERIFTLEWFLVKLQFRSEEVISIDNAIESGCLFWKLDEFDKRVSEMLPELEKANQINKRAQAYFSKKISESRSRLNMAQQTLTMQQVIQSFIQQLVKTKPDQRSEYMNSYIEFRYQQIVGSMHKLTKQYYLQGNLNAVQILRQGISQVTRMDHVGIKFYQPNNYSVHNSIVLPNAYALEASNLIYGSIQYEDTLNFKRCVKPVINERALEPPQVTLFQTLYSHDNLRVRLQSQFAGQSASTVNSIPFKALDSALLLLSDTERTYSQSFIVQAKFQANDFMETVYNDSSLKQMKVEDAYSLEQLVDAKRFMNETTQAILLKNALICWHENSILPDTIEMYNRFEQNFRQNYFWKQMEYKEELTRKLNFTNTFSSIPSSKEIKEMAERIDRLVNDNSLPTEDAIKKRDALVKSLREEFLALKKKVTLDSYFNTKAEISVYSNEIEKFLIRASVKTLDAETAALSKCFTLQVPAIQFHIHPFQQFAGTFYDQCDPQMHLDVSNKLSAVQHLITKMRNRCTQVETLTSGPGIVLTAKDINDILIEFCRVIIKDQEKQFKSRTEGAFLKEEELKNAIYAKDMRIKTLENRLKRISENLENVIDARLFEKGNQLIYELDSSTRVLNIFKQTMGDLETKLLQRIYGEQLEKFARMNNELSLKELKFNKYQETIMNMISANFAEEMDSIKQIIKQKAENAKISAKDGVYKPVELYHGGFDHRVGGHCGSIVPKDFQHLTTCSCYKPNPAYPVPTVELVKLETLSEAEARHELARVCALNNKQRLFWLVKDMTTRSKYQDQINHLRKQLNNNTYLWDQLAETQKREKVLRQELLYTQQALSSAEKTIQNLQEENKTLDAERGRLQTFKSSKVEKFKELEQRVHQMDLMETVDTNKLLVALTKQHDKLKEVEGVKQIYDARIRSTEDRADAQKRDLERKLHTETTKTQQVIDKMEQMKFELKMLETNDSSVASIWKKKCLDLFEVCQSMKQENDELRQRCKELISRGIELAETIDTIQHQGGGQKLQGDSQSEGRVSTRNQGYVIRKRSQIVSSQGNPQMTTPMILEQIKASKDLVLDQHQQWITNKQLRPPATQQRGRTIECESPQAAPSTVTTRKGLGTNSLSRPGGQDIRSILSGDSFSRNQKTSTIQPQKSQQTKKRQNYTNQAQVNQQDSLFNQSLGTSVPLSGGRYLTTAGNNPKHFKLRHTHLLSFDLHGKQMPLRVPNEAQSPITSAKETVQQPNSDQKRQQQESSSDAFAQIYKQNTTSLTNAERVRVTSTGDQTNILAPEVTSNPIAIDSTQQLDLIIANQP